MLFNNSFNNLYETIYYGIIQNPKYINVVYKIIWDLFSYLNIDLIKSFYEDKIKNVNIETSQILVIIILLVRSEYKLKLANKMIKYHCNFSLFSHAEINRINNSK